MGNKKLRPQDAGRIVGRVASLVLEKDISFEDAFNYYMKNDRTKTMEKYDIGSEKTDIITKAEERIANLTNKLSVKTQEKTKKSKKTTAKDSEKSGKPDMSKLAKIRSVRLKRGGVDFIETEDGQQYIKKQQNNTKAGLFCEEGSHAEVIDEDDGSAGCFYDD